MSKHNRNTGSSKQVEEPLVEGTAVEEEQGEDVVVEEAASVAVAKTEPTQSAVVQEPRHAEVNQTKPQEAKIPVDNLTLFLTQYHEKIVSLKNDEEVAKIQVSFFKKIISALSKPLFDETRADLNAILKYINQNRDKGLDETNLFRGAAHWTESPHEYSTFRRLIWVFLETCDPQTRKAVAGKVDFSSLEKSLTPAQFNNLVSFYS